MENMPFVSDDVIYMRYFQGGKVLRVAKLDSRVGVVLALYPSDNPETVYGEVFQRIEDSSAREPISRSEVKDDVLEQLLDGKKIKDILKNYEPVNGAKGSDNGRSYAYVNRGEEIDFLKIRTFHIMDDRDEDVMLAKQRADARKFLSPAGTE